MAINIIIPNLPSNLRQSLKPNQPFALIQRIDPNQPFIANQSFDPNQPYTAIQSVDPKNPINTSQLSASIQALTPNKLIKTVSIDSKKISSDSDMVRISTFFYLGRWLVTVVYQDGSHEQFIADVYLYIPF